MNLKIQDETVRRNIEIFKIILKRASHSAGLPERKTESFKAFVNRISGEVRFVDLNSEPLDSPDWVLVLFRFSLPEQKQEAMGIEVLGGEGALFSWDGFDTRGFLVLKETVKTVQLMAKFLPSLQNLNSVFREFSQISLDSFLDEIPGRDLVHEAWSQLDRVACERLLERKLEGVFFFRQDLFAAILEEELSKAHKKSVKCITLTYLDTNHKIVDHTLVKWEEGWLVYDNDPCLRGVIYPTIRSLLDRFKTVLKAPLLTS